MVLRGEESVWPRKLGKYRLNSSRKSLDGAIHAFPWCSLEIALKSLKYDVVNWDVLPPSPQLSPKNSLIAQFSSKPEFSEDGKECREGKEGRETGDPYSCFRFSKCLSQFTKSSRFCCRVRKSTPELSPLCGGLSIPSGLNSC